jgi:cytochrome P450
MSLAPRMQDMTLEIIARTVFGSADPELRQRLKQTINLVSRPGPHLLFLVVMGPERAARSRLLRRALAPVDELIYAEIEQRRRDPGDDVLSMLLEARHEDGSPMSDQELRDELMTLLVAGHETTATGLSWALDLLMHNPQVLARAREGDPAYLDAVVKEALRLRPVVPGIGRVVRGGPFELGGYTLPEGVEINPSISGLHRRGESFPDPKAFRPERFLGDGAPDTYTWIPFGGGTRRCLGASFAQQEMRIVLQRVLERTALRPVRRRPERVRRQGITLVPRDGVRVRLVSRRP